MQGLILPQKVDALISKVISCKEVDGPIKPNQKHEFSTLRSNPRGSWYKTSQSNISVNSCLFWLGPELQMDFFLTTNNSSSPP